MYVCRNVFLRTLVLLIIMTTASGCSPFGNQSVINVIDEITDFFGKTVAEFNSGGTESLVSLPQSGSSTDQHSVLLSVGSAYSQSSTITSPDGHEVLITLGVE